MSRETASGSVCKRLTPVCCTSAPSLDNSLLAPDPSAPSQDYSIQADNHAAPNHTALPPCGFAKSTNSAVSLEPSHLISSPFPSRSARSKGVWPFCGRRKPQVPHALLQPIPLHNAHVRAEQVPSLHRTGGPQSALPLQAWRVASTGSAAHLIHSQIAVLAAEPCAISACSTPRCPFSAARCNAVLPLCTNGRPATSMSLLRKPGGSAQPAGVKLRACRRQRPSRLERGELVGPVIKQLLNNGVLGQGIRPLAEEVRHTGQRRRSRELLLLRRADCRLRRPGQQAPSMLEQDLERTAVAMLLSCAVLCPPLCAGGTHARAEALRPWRWPVRVWQCSRAKDVVAYAV